MKITIIIPHADHSGGVRVVAIYAALLSNRGHHVQIISFRHKQPSLLEQVKSVVKGQGLLPRRNQGSHLDGLEVEHHIISKYRPITDTDVPNADVVIATWWETAEWVATLSPSKGAKVYLIQHHEVFDHLPRARVEATYSLPLYKITVAQWLKNLMSNRYFDRDVALVPNSVDTSLFCAPLRKKQSVPTVGLIYDPNYWKGCDISLKAFALAAQQIPNLKLISFGFYPITDDLPLPEGTPYALTPPQTEIRNFYASCDVWLFGSRCEGFGLPILEAMACRTPVIATPAGAAPELLTDGGGILVKAEASEEMAQAIQRICSLNEKEWQRMSDAAHRKAINYSWDDAVELFEEALYTAIARQKDKRISPASQLSSSS